MDSNESGTRSLWQSTVEPRSYGPLSTDVEADVCVVGAGLAGLTIAYELAKNGRRVVVLEKAKNIGAGETAHTTAHLTNAMDDRIADIEKHLSIDAARQARDSHGAAIDWIERVAGDEGIDCEFRRVDGFLVPGPGEDASGMEAEYQSALRAGFDAELVASSPVEGLGGPCIRFPNQAEYHPLRFLNGIAEALERHGGRVFCGAHVVEVAGGAEGHARTEEGRTVRARSVVLATNSPAGRYVETMKMVPYRTFAVALEVTAGSVPRALYWDTMDPYHYVRLADASDGRELLIVGGGDYQSGTRDRGVRVFEELIDWAHQRFDITGADVYRWSGQVLEPADHLGFIGRSHSDADVYLCTGDSGQGMTNSVTAAMRIGDLILGRTERWPVYDPRRVSGGAVGEYLRDAGLVVGRMLDHLKPGDVGSANEIPRGGGAVVRRGLREIAVFRDDDGVLHECSAICTHAGCVVHWNSTEKSWDCPCHGSRFDPAGQVLNGPAVSPLRPAEE